MNQYAKDLFSEEASMDHFVVGDPNVQNDVLDGMQNCIKEFGSQ